MKSFLDRFRRKGTDEGDPKTSESPGDVEQEVAKESLASGELAASDPVPSEEEAIRETPPAPLREEIATFVLGDFLKRIPEQLLAKGPHDETLPLAFDVSDLSSRIARGQTTLSLAEIYKRAPHLFRAEIRETDNIEVRFPWQKLLELVKAAETSSPGAGLTESAAESLAQRLRDRKRTTGGPAAEVKPGSTPRQTMTAGEPSPAPSQITASQYTPTYVESPVITSTPNLQSMASEISFVVPTPQELEPSPMFILAQAPELATAASEEKPQSTSSRELVAERDAAALEVARTKSEYERRFTALQEERRTLIEQRDCAMAELERMIKEIDEHRDQAEIQKLLAARTVENATRAASERASAQEQLDAQRATVERHLREIAALRAEIDQYRKGTGGQAAEQLQKSATARTDTSATDGERPRREYQRQVDELQRRIGALESNQKESAQELGRERETRIRAERAASAAERARGEATAMVESIRTDLRREADGIIRKRDAEFARVQRELGEKIESLTDAQCKAVSERDELAAEVAKLKKAAQESSAAATQAVDTHWESRAVASLEADMENYRGRIKTLIKERDALAKEKEQLAAKSAASDEIAKLKETSEKLAVDELATLRTQCEALAAENTSGLARIEELTAQTAARPADRSPDVVAQIEQLQTELSSLRTKSAEELQSTVAERDQAREQLAQVTREKDALKARADADAAAVVALRKAGPQDTHAEERKARGRRGAKN